MTTVTPVWTINTLERSLPDNIVTVIHWTVSLTSEDGYTSSAYGSLGLPPADPENFIPYSDLSPETVTEWIRNVMGEEQFAAYESSLTAQIESKRNPVSASGLPW
jgi:hypothetical protein